MFYISMQYVYDKNGLFVSVLKNTVIYKLFVYTFVKSSKATIHYTLYKKHRNEETNCDVYIRK